MVNCCAAQHAYERQLLDSCSKPAVQRSFSQRYSADPCQDDVNGNNGKQKIFVRMPFNNESNYIEPMSLTNKRTYLEVIDDNTTPLG